MDRKTGKQLDGLDHVRQSINDILTTPIGSRVMRRNYGSRLFQLVDAPQNRSTLIAIYAATAEALNRWEPRVRVRRVQAVTSTRGDDSLSATLTLELDLDYLPTGEPLRLQALELRG